MPVAPKNDQPLIQENSESRWDKLADTEFPESYPTKESVDILYDEIIFQRASQSVFWAYSAP